MIQAMRAGTKPLLCGTSLSSEKLPTAVDDLRLLSGCELPLRYLRRLARRNRLHLGKAGLARADGYKTASLLELNVWAQGDGRGADKGVAQSVVPYPTAIEPLGCS